jgi:hypothetical protein
LLVGIPLGDVAAFDMNEVNETEDEDEDIVSGI